MTLFVNNYSHGWGAVRKLGSSNLEHVQVGVPWHFSESRGLGELQLRVGELVDRFRYGSLCGSVLEADLVVEAEYPPVASGLAGSSPVAPGARFAGHSSVTIAPTVVMVVVMGIPSARQGHRNGGGNANQRIRVEVEPACAVDERMEVSCGAFVARELLRSSPFGTQAVDVELHLPPTAESM